MVADDFVVTYLFVLSLQESGGGEEEGGRNYKNICISQERLDGDWLGML